MTDEDIEMDMLLEKIREMAKRSPRKEKEPEISADGNEDAIPDTLRCVTLGEVIGAMNNSPAVKDYAKFEEAAAKIVPSWEDPCKK